MFPEILSIAKDILSAICVCIKEHFLDWVITSIITYFTVKAATKQYYHNNSKKIAQNIMELGLRSMFNLHYSEALPPSAKAIFVEYGKSSFFMSNKLKAESKVPKRSINDLRKTVTSCGKSEMEVSLYRPKNYGVLGVANKRGRPLLFDFEKGMLFELYAGKIIKLEIQEEGNSFMYDGEKLSDKTNERSVMIAVPIIKSFLGSKQLGGVTFDMKPSEKTIYQEILPNDDEKTKKDKMEANKRVFDAAVSTANYLKTAYFQQKGDEIR